MVDKRGKLQPIPLLILGVIAVIIIYGYFLPVSDKCLLIPDLPECIGEESISIISEATGILEPSDTAARYTLENVQLFRRDSLEIGDVFGEITTQKSWFSSAPVSTTFAVQEGGKDVKLFVFVNDASGKLKVLINGKKVAKLQGEGVHTVSLPLGLLEDSNEIILKSTTPWIPLKVNRHDIGKVVLREEYTITQNRVARELNLEEDFQVIDKAILKFDTDCFSQEDLTLFVNNQKIFSGILCEGFEKDVLEFLGDENKITFASEGNWYIEDIKLDVGVEQKTWPVYYFDVPSDKLEGGLVSLNMMFNRTGEKKLTVYLNGEALSIETYKSDFSTTVNRYLEEGQNSIIIIPETELTLEKVELI